MKNEQEKTSPIHISVLLAETLEILAPMRGGVFVDATLGLGGHSEAILESAPNTKVIGIDQDAEALAFAEKRLARFGARFQAQQVNFSQLNEVLAKAEVEAVDGILADLGVSSLQLDSETRGFSFRFDAPLDMRMNAQAETQTVAELLEDVSEFELARIIYEYGEERFSRRIARRITERREKGNLPRTTKDLAALVSQVVPRSKKDKIHPATRTFQALRIAVNGELEILEKFLTDAVEKLAPEGRLAVIGFHSLEDRIVKQTFRKLAGQCQCPPNFPRCVCGSEKKIEILTRRPIAPGEAEIKLNPRAASAKLRGCLKIPRN